MSSLLNIVRFIKRGLNALTIERRYKNQFPNASINMNPLLTEIDLRVKLDNNVKINKGVMIRGNVKLGRGTLINGPSRIVAGKESVIEIGQFCSIGGFCAFYTANHPTTEKVATFQTGNGYYASIFSENCGKDESIEMGSDVWVGSHCVILAGIKIGNGAVLAAGAIVTRDVPGYAIVAGCPARVIKYRFNEELIAYLEVLQWWNWSDEKLNRNKAFFNSDLTQASIADLKNIISD